MNLIELVEISRDVGPNKLTRVIFRRQGNTFEFKAGRHTGINRIKSLAQTLKLDAIAGDTP